MNTQIYTSRFEGNLFELKGYSMVIMDTGPWLSTINANKSFIEQNLLINFYESEEVLAWCICEALKRAYPEVKVLGHYPNDRYEAVYDSLFFNQEMVVRNRLLPSFQNSGIIKAVRVLPMLDKTIVALGS